MKKVAFDMDDCLTETWRSIIDLVEAEFGLSLKEPEEFYITSSYLTPEQERHFWQKYLTHIYQHSPPREGAREVLRRLEQKGYEIYILTARMTYDERIEPLTREWFSRFDIPFHHLHLDAGTKAHLCKQWGIPLMVEDNTRNSEILSKEGIQVLLLDQPYNRHYRGEGVRRVHSWLEIEEEIYRFFE